jgi:OmcA/MtrC family decaheme c-type cytochrome
VVATEKCNVCHGALGTTSGSNTLSEAFHGGARNIVEACSVCHDPNKVSGSTVMTNGLALNESYQFKRMIHGIHGNSKRNFPFTHGNPVQGNFDDTGKLTAQGTFLADQSVTINGTSTVVIKAGTVVPAGSTFQSIADTITAAARAKGYTGAAIAPAENYAAEVAYPQVGLNCNSCHVDNSYKVDRGTLGAVVSKPAGATDPMQWLVISPKAASCTACHDSPAAIAHVTSFGNASFGNRTQAQSLQTQEICADCHAAGGFKGVDIVHGQK